MGRTGCDRCHAVIVDGKVHEGFDCWEALGYDDDNHIPCAISEIPPVIHAHTGPSDPHGTDQHSPGAKLDNGKIKSGLVIGGFSAALEEVAEVGTFGANKYTEFGYKEVPEAGKRYMDALYRHLSAHFQGEETDPESGLLHLAHAAWNSLAVLEFYLEGDKGYVE